MLDGDYFLKQKYYDRADESTPKSGRKVEFLYYRRNEISCCMKLIRFEIGSLKTEVGGPSGLYISGTGLILFRATFSQLLDLFFQFNSHQAIPTL
jgi:hypothetical protein